MSTTYDVTGMTCGHCVHAVSTEVEAITGVRTVSVDVATGRLTVEGEGFTSDPEFKDVVARRPKGTGGQFTLPNQ